MDETSRSCAQRRGRRYSRALPSAPPCLASTCSAMRCATRSTRGPRASSCRAEQRPRRSQPIRSPRFKTMPYDVDAVRRREFPWAAQGECIYLNHASTGPLPQRAVKAIHEFNELRAHPYRLPDELQFATLARGRELVARLIHADPEEIALAVNTSYGINLAAFALPLQAGDVVLTPDREFPANVYPWMQLARRRGIAYRRVPCCDGLLDEQALRRELEDPAVRAVAVSWVGFSSGYVADLE